MIANGLHALTVCFWDGFDWLGEKFGTSQETRAMQARIAQLESQVTVLQELVTEVAESLHRAVDRQELQAAETRVMNSIQACCQAMSAPPTAAVYVPYAQPARAPDAWGRFG
ncbi:unnamed protein product [Symbiodinium necroappetens]|uniref:Uncharacterized protein n=1 Tax=Symbiodinium necroappetens TaxID=1628268 RepID=A0A813CLN1_9DINO|nr:unnamed protein product [Symbiodinium necroappetens]